MNLQLLGLKKRLVMRGYQETIVSDIINHFNIGIPYVLGSCPSSGKTEMAIEAMIRLMESGQVNRVLILAHSTNVLKENFYNRLMEYFEEGDTIDVMRGQKGYNYDARIQVMIPQNINHIDGQFDLIITDEAQHNVLAEDGNYSRIVEMVEPKFQLLLTGTPSKFILRNNYAERDGLSEPYHINTIGMDVIGIDHFHNVRFDLIKSAYGFTNADYGETRELLTNIDFDFTQTRTTVNNVIVGVVRNVALRNGVTLPVDADFVVEGRKLVQSGKFGKTLIMCRNIEQANQISDIISDMFHVRVAVSQSQNDTNSSNLTRFKDNEFQFLCVVNRAREGYDDNKVVNLIDITMTHNIDLIYQMFCRVVRLDKDNPNPKLYVKVTSNADGMPEYTQSIMTAALMLGATENLAMFNGNNFRGLVMPRIEREETPEEDIIVDGVVDIIDGQGNVIGHRRLSEMMALDLIAGMFTDDEENLIHGNARYAMTTLGESLARLTGEIELMSLDDTYNLCISQSLTSKGLFTPYRLENSHLNIPSNPWRTLGIGEGEYFDRIKIELDIPINFISPEDTFQICINNNLTAPDIYQKFRREHPELKLHATPFVFLNQTSGQFFHDVRELLNFNYFPIDETFDLCVNNRLTTGTLYIDHVNKLEGRYHTRPWERLEYKTQTTFFNAVKTQLGLPLDYLSVEETFDLCVDNNFTSSPQYRKFVKDNPNIKLLVSPWEKDNEKSKDFFDRVKEKLGLQIISEEETFILCVENDLTDSPLYLKFRLGNKNISLHSRPWKKVGKSITDYFLEVKKVIEEQNNKTHKQAYLGEFSEMNKLWNTTNSYETHKRLKEDKTEWVKYHELYSNSRKKWGEIPYEVIANKLKGRPDWIVGDFGCGENLLSKEIKNKVHAFDHVGFDDNVTVCDLVNVPLHNNVLDVVVFSLSLMGTNYVEYFKEAYRVLKPMGLILIAEPCTRWEDKEDDLKDKLEAAGFKVNGEIKHSDRFIYVDAIKY